METVFNELITSANGDKDASQVSGRQPVRSNAAMAHYNAGLGYIGLGNKSKAREELNTALTLSPDYLNAKITLDQL